MKLKVSQVHNVGKHCFVCGVENQAGLKANFYELENGELCGIFTPQEHHQSYPGRTHGGVAAAMLDETIGRAINIQEKDVWGVTGELSIRYKKPVPLNVTLKVMGRITLNAKRMFEGEGEILLPNGDIAVTAHGKYVKLPADKITDGGFIENEWNPASVDSVDYIEI